MDLNDEELFLRKFQAEETLTKNAEMEKLR